MKLAFNFAKRISSINFVDITLSDLPHQRLLLSVIVRHLHTCNPLVGLYDDCIKHEKPERFSNVVEYLYYSLMYQSTIPVEILKYLSDPIENGTIRLRVRDLDAKHKSIALFVDRLYSIFERPKFNITLRLDPIYDDEEDLYSALIKRVDAIQVTMRFNYLNRFVTKLYADPNTMIKILMYLLLLR